MDHNMFLSYDYAKQNRRRWRTNAPPLRNMLMAMVSWSDACSIAWLACPGLHWKPLDAAIGQLLPLYHLGGCQGEQTKQGYIMYPLWWPFWWPLQCAGPIPCKSPDGGSLGLSYKPLNTAIGWALALIGQSVIAMLQFGLMFEVCGVGDGEM